MFFLGALVHLQALDGHKHLFFPVYPAACQFCKQGRNVSVYWKGNLALPNLPFQKAFLI